MANKLITASELVNWLTSMMKVHGDLPIYVSQEWGYDQPIHWHHVHVVYKKIKKGNSSEEVDPTKTRISIGF